MNTSFCFYMKFFQTRKLFSRNSLKRKNVLIKGIGEKKKKKSTRATVVAAKNWRATIMVCRHLHITCSQVFSTCGFHHLLLYNTTKSHAFYIYIQ